MVDTIKFSQMTDGGNINNNDKVPGLLAGDNVLFNNPWTFLPSGTTAQRPAPSPVINYRLRFNTDDQVYEFYNAIASVWTQLKDSAVINGPFVTYTSDVNLPDAQNLGLLSNGLLRQTVSSGISTVDIVPIPVPVTAGGTGLSTIPEKHILYSPTTDSLAALPTANDCVLVTDNSFNIFWSNFLPANLNIPTPLIIGSNGFNIATFADVPFVTDYFSFISGTANNAIMTINSSNTDASFQINGKGTGGVQIGSTGASTTPVAFYNGTFRFFMNTGALTADRYLTFPDADVTLVAGTMANAPVNTNITSMTGLTGALRAPTSILDSNGNIVLSFTGTPGAVNYLDITNFGVTPQIRAIGSAADIDIILDGKGIGGALIRTGTAGTTPLEIGIGGDPFGFDFVLPTLTAQRSLTFPDGNVVLVSGTMANAPVNTNITSMTGLTGSLQQPTAIQDTSGNNVLSFIYNGAQTDYIAIQNGNDIGGIPANQAGIFAQSSNPNAPLNISGKGINGVDITSPGSNQPMAITNGTFKFAFQVPTWTATHTLTFPDGNVTLTPGTMATTDQIVIWSNVSGTSQTASPNNGFVIGNAAQTSITLPATAPIGSVVSVAGQGAGGWILQANAGQTINMAASSTSVGGALTSAEQYDAISVVCVVADTTWVVESAITTGFTIS